jgi:hypothetical protein
MDSIGAMAIYFISPLLSFRFGDRERASRMLIGIISTLVSSIALVAVAASLLLQARQLRTNQVQVTRTAQQELIKFSLENPSAVAEVLSYPNPEAHAKDAYLNWYISYLSMSYEIKTISEANLRFLLRDSFASENSRRWWAIAGGSYHDWAMSRRDKEFVSILEEEFGRPGRGAEPAEAGAAPPAG